MFVIHKLVMVVILDPVTPGAFRASIDWSKPSSSATDDDIATVVLKPGSCVNTISSKQKFVTDQALPSGRCET